MNSLRHKLTFVVIPEANKRVYRIKLSRAAAYGAALAALLLVAAAGYVHFTHLKSVAAARHYKTVMNSKTSQLEQDVAAKNKTIEELQSEIFHLSEQAAQIRTKVEQIKQLEKDLKPGPTAEPTDKPVSLQQPSLTWPNAMGGPPSPATLSQVKQLAEHTGAELAALGTETNRLSGKLTRSKQLLLEQKLYQDRAPSLWPTRSRTVTSPYGYRKDPINAKLSFHRGIDIAGKTNDPVYATADGTVRTVGSDKFHGNNVVIEHAGGVNTWYMHLNKAAVKQGQSVRKGQMIGTVGSTGRSTGPHLHYEVLKGGQSLDPGPYLPQSKRKPDKDGKRA